MKIFAPSNVLSAILAVALLCAARPAAAAPNPSIGSIAKSPYIGAIVVDARTGAVLREDGPNRPAYPASLTKMMTLFVALDAVQQGQTRLDAIVHVTDAAAKIGGSQVYLDPKEAFTLDELLYAMMVHSACDAAYLVAQHVGGTVDAFVARMNAKAREIGLSPITHFISPHGFPPDTGRPDIGTPADLAKLCVALIREHPDTLRYTGTWQRTFPELSVPGQVAVNNHRIDMVNRNPFVNSYPGCDGLKTGYFQKAGYSIAVTAQRDGARVIAVIMGCASKADRNAAVTSLLDVGLAVASRGPMPPPSYAQPQPEPEAAPAEPEAPADDPGAVAVADADDDEAPTEPEAPSAGSGWWKSIFWIGLGAIVVFIAFRILQRRLLLQR